MLRKAVLLDTVDIDVVVGVVVDVVVGIVALVLIVLTLVVVAVVSRVHRECEVEGLLVRGAGVKGLRVSIGHLMIAGVLATARV